jgi:5'-3' exonuclease
MLSELVNVDEMLAEVSLEDKGEPFTPFEQLMGCMPPSSAHFLPELYRWLLKDESSLNVDFYPRTFTAEMNGKRWPWDDVVLLRFIILRRLIDTARTLVPNNNLTKEERQRNTNGNAWVSAHEDTVAERVPLESTQWDYQPEGSAVKQPRWLQEYGTLRPDFRC